MNQFVKLGFVFCISLCAVHGDCVYPLVGIATGTDTTCSSSEENWFPLAGNECYAWASSNNSHENSASALECVDGNTFKFTQYAGNLECKGNGVTKTIKLNECKQGYPLTIYDMGLDLSCCVDQNSANCKKGSPYTSRDGSEIYMDGVLCEDTPVAAPSADQVPQSTSNEIPQSGGENNNDDDSGSKQLGKFAGLLFSVVVVFLQFNNVVIF